MYRCDVCRAVCGPGKPRLTHAIMRPVRYLAFPSWAIGTEIDQEFQVCPACKAQLATGTPVTVLLRRAVLPIAPYAPQEFGPLAPEATAIV